MENLQGVVAERDDKTGLISMDFPTDGGIDLTAEEMLDLMSMISRVMNRPSLKTKKRVTIASRTAHK